jgi:hypothetical protein
MKPFHTVVIDVCQLLEQRNGLTVGELAAALHQDHDEVRRHIAAFADVDLDATVDTGLGRAYLLIDPADSAAADPEPSDDDVVWLEGTAEDILGVEQFDATVLGPLYQAAEELLAQEPDNDTLRDATAILRKRFLPGLRRRREDPTGRVATLRTAIDERRRVRIVYSRAWQPGVTDRVIEPYDITYTGRGAEVDAGPVADDGSIRTFLVARIRELDLLQETFERPADALARCIAKRELAPVTGYSQHGQRWVLDKWSERVDVRLQDDNGFTFVAHVLPPVRWRCALMHIVADGIDFDDVRFVEEGSELAERLLRHHGLADSRRG